jgi:hypothetical protein
MIDGRTKRNFLVMTVTMLVTAIVSTSIAFVVFS